MLNKILFKIFGLFDLLKDFLVHWGIRILLVVMVFMILHNVIKMSEVTTFYKGEYKTLVSGSEETKKLMNVYTVGEGEKTIVILPEFGAQSPVIEYKTIVEALRNEYKVAVVEYYGYGYSMSTSVPRTNEKIASEIRMALQEREVYGPYVLVAHDTSNIYAMYFQEHYPDLVSSIISIDGWYPAEIEDSYRAEQIAKYVSNINLTSIFELTGFERIASYVSPKTFYIDKMQAIPNMYTKEDFSVYRNRIGSQYLSRTMVKEAQKLEENMMEMKDYKYPEELPVLEILATETVNMYNYDKEQKKTTITLKKLAEDVITKSDNQKIVEIKGDKQLQLTNSTELNATIKDFLMTY